MPRGIKANYIMLRAKPFSIEQKDETGAVISRTEGVKCKYLSTDTLEDYTVEDRFGGISKGESVFETTFPIEFFEKMPSVPGMYEFILEYTDVSRTSEYNGKSTTKVIQALTPVGLNFVGDIKITVEKPTPPDKPVQPKA